MPRKKSAENTVEPLVVSPREAQALLGVKRSYLYTELLKKGELSFYKEGGLTRITVDSINRHIATRLAESSGRLGRCNAHKSTA
jgi:excisionase family DNA binding protein